MTFHQWMESLQLQSLPVPPTSKEETVGALINIELDESGAVFIL